MTIESKIFQNRLDEMNTKLSNVINQCLPFDETIARLVEIRKEYADVVDQVESEAKLTEDGFFVIDDVKQV